MRARWCSGALPVALALVAVGCASGAADVAVNEKAALRTCDRFASIQGRDAAPGTLRRPYRTAQHLVNRLRPGEVGCLVGGTFAEDVTMRRGGTARARIVVRSAPGTVATLRGRLWIENSADYVTFRRLRLNGRNDDDLPSPTINSNYVHFFDNNVTNDNTAICFILGSHDYGVAVRPVIARNRIHNCGELPPTNHDHGIYALASRGAVIRHNYIYDNADRGIQLYTDAQRSKIVNNVIDGNGQGIIFSGDSGYASSNNYVARNIISNSKVRYNVESHWPDDNRVGVGNRVTQNCIWNGERGNIELPPEGFVAFNNVIADPRYANRARKDFRLREGSPCRRYGPGR